MLLSQEAENLLSEITDLEIRQKVLHEQRISFESAIKEYESKLNVSKENLDVTEKAITVLQELSNDSVQKSYEVMQQNINEALKRIFPNKTREIEIREYPRGTNMQLEIVLHVENGVERSIANGSGHGVAQVISLLCIMTLIVFTGGRRFLVLDEVMSGMSKETKEAFDDVLHDFADIGFQFLIVEHNYTPKGSYVVELESKNELSKVVNTYMSLDGENLYDNNEEDYIID